MFTNLQSLNKISNTKLLLRFVFLSPASASMPEGRIHGLRLYLNHDLHLSQHLLVSQSFPLFRGHMKTLSPRRQFSLLFFLAEFYRSQGKIRSGGRVLTSSIYRPYSTLKLFYLKLNKSEISTILSEFILLRMQLRHLFVFLSNWYVYGICDRITWVKWENDTTAKGSFQVLVETTPGEFLQLNLVSFKAIKFGTRISSKKRTLTKAIHQSFQ